MSNELYRFETASLIVICDALPEEMDPAESFSEQEDIDAVRNGDVEWFCARVRVLHKATGAELAADYLGGCAYNTFGEFVTSHRDPDPLNRNSSIMQAARGANTVICHYFPGMISEACSAARKSLASIANTYVRKG